MYRVELNANEAGNSIAYSTSSGATSMRGMAVFTFRNNSSSPNSPELVSPPFDHGFYKNNAHTRTISFSACNKSRIAEVIFPTHEIDDNRIVDYWVKVGSAAWIHKTFNATPTHSEIRLDEFTNIPVPAGVTTISVKAQSNDASFILGNVMATMTNCCPIFTGTPTVNNHVSCFGGSDGSITVKSNCTGPNCFYKINGVPGWQQSNTSSKTFNSLPAGTYTVRMASTNTGACAKVVGTATITQPTALTASTTIANMASCFSLCDGAASVNAQGGVPPYNYNWSSGATTSSANGLCAGTHTITITDSNSCTATTTVVITEPPLLEIMSTTNSPRCFEECNASVDATPQGGTPPYSFQWSNGATTEDIVNACAGNYILSVTDQNGCLAVDSVHIAQTPKLEVDSAQTIVKPACFGTCDGTITVGPIGGTAPYTYHWGDGQTTQTATGLCPGIHHVIIMDANVCLVSTCATIIEAPQLLGTITTTSPICNLDFGGIYFPGNTTASAIEGTATVLVQGGTVPYTYLWSDGQTTQVATGLPVGTYTATITDANGITRNSPLQLLQKPILLRQRIKRLNLLR